MTALDPAVRGNQPKGPKRWQRAAQWAAEHPETVAGQKYLARVATATVISLADPITVRNGWLHYRWSWQTPGEPQYTGQTCGTMCAILQLQLDLGTQGLSKLHEKTSGNYGRPEHFITERPANSPRRGKCLVCGNPVV